MKTRAKLFCPLKIIHNQFTRKVPQFNLVFLAANFLASELHNNNRSLLTQRYFEAVRSCSHACHDRIIGAYPPAASAARGHHRPQFPTELGSHWIRSNSLLCATKMFMLWSSALDTVLGRSHIGVQFIQYLLPQPPHIIEHTTNKYLPGQKDH